jgi:hypothetical protein
LHQKRNAGSDSIVFAEGVKPVEIILPMQAQYGDKIAYRVVKFTNG